MMTGIMRATIKVRDSAQPRLRIVVQQWTRTEAKSYYKEVPGSSIILEFRDQEELQAIITRIHKSIGKELA